MTDDELRAALAAAANPQAPQPRPFAQADTFRQKIMTRGAVAEAAAPSAERARAFRDRVMGSPTTQAGIDRGESLLGVLGAGANGISGLIGGPLPALATAGTNALVRALGGETAKDAQPSRADGGPDDLSTRAQLQLRKDAAVGEPGPLREMDTPLADVQAGATLAQQARRPGGGGGGNAGLGLRAELDAARQAGLRTMGEERDLTGQLGVERAGRVMSVADLQTAEADRQMAEIEAQRRIDAEAAERHQAFLAKSEALTDQLGEMKTDPGRLLRNADNQTQFTMGLGATLGGMLAGMNGGPNTSLDRLDKIIDRDLRSQEQEIDGKKAQLQARDSLFGRMLQETGDRRLAAQQSRVLMLEASKMKLQADSDRLGIPEVRTNAELATNAIQQKIDAAKTGMAKEAYDLFQRQAAAAASARAAAEKQAWERAMTVAELGLKRDKIEIERRQAEGGTIEDLNKQTQALGKELSDKDLAQGREAVENAKRRLAHAKPDDGLPGVGVGADMRSRLRPTNASGYLNPVQLVANAAFGLSDTERVSRGDWEKIKLSYQSQITGSGASEKEREMLSAAFEGAKSPAEQRNAIAQADAFFSRREAAIKAGFDPRAVESFEQRMQGYRPQMPASFREKK